MFNIIEIMEPIGIGKLFLETIICHSYDSLFIFQWEIYCISLFLCMPCFFFPGYFQDFSFSLVFISETDVSRFPPSLSFCLSCLGLTEILVSVVCYLSFSFFFFLEVLCHYYIKYFLCPFFLFSSEIPILCMLDHLI